MYFPSESGSVRPVNGFVLSFNSLMPESDQKMSRLASKHVFQQNNHGSKWVYLLLTIQKTCLMKILF